MDPLTAISLAASIVAFVDFGSKLIKGTIEIYETTDGTLAGNRCREAVAAAMKDLASRLTPPQSSLVTDEEKQLYNLAMECHAICDNLLDLLRRLKPKDMSSKRQSLWAAVKSVFHESECEDLEKRLDACRRQLEMHMNFKSVISLHSLSDYVQNNTEKLKLLETSVANLSLIGDEVHESVSQLLSIQKDVTRITIGNIILASLDFEGRTTRQRMVDKAHEKTFQWIFDAPQPLDLESSSDIEGDWTSGNEQEIKRTKKETIMRQQMRERFLQWLSSGTGVFHISGKMGCGKSTLMKFLSHHPETDAQLQKWADGNKLVFANFFFWQPGSSLQKSLNGLYRSLLYKVLERHSEMFPNVFPHVWETVQARAIVRGAETKVELEEEEIAKAFTFLISQKDSGSGFSFCFFIDGLDEYEAKTYDHKDLAIKLTDWTSASNVKLCVSSREHNAFMNTFSPMLRLPLHTLTQYDIKAYITDRLAHSQDTKGIQALERSIFRKANGVFFWVALVVRDIREQLENGVEPSYLIEIVSGLPDELDDLYSRILQGLNTYSRKRAYQTLAMMPYTTGDKSKLRLDLISYSFLSEYNENDKFARGDQFEARLPALRDQEQEMKRNARLNLNGWCRGLVEVNDNGDIDYAHRSVAEFLSHSRIQGKISSSLQGIHPVSILSELELARCRILVNSNRLKDSPFSLVHLRHACELDHPPYEFLRDMDTGLQSSMEGIDNADFQGEIKVVHVLWRIENDPTTTNTTLKRILLFYTAINESRYSILEILLERRIVTPETRTNFMPPIIALLLERSYILGGIGDGRSIWEYFLIREFYNWLYAKHGSEQFLDVAKRLLHYGADPRFRFITHIIQLPDKPRDKPSTEDHFLFGDPTKSIPFSICHVWEREPHEDFHDAIRMLRPLPIESTGPWYEMSFTGWIQAMEDFEGKADLLELLQDKICERQNDEMQQSSAVLRTSTNSISTKGLVADAPAKAVQRGPAFTYLNWLYLSSFALEITGAYGMSGDDRLICA
ncbi:hypothetical protein F53441_10739 [Fusarium austroafricanum]|uniref:Nephrocystin 3-like N-terminal domain-containing protein n=1 Tax=Fusarium austroafricanum TaxID=2364996 RepID=A0A8H4K871_9HYPO|nr:hypothetical protein F53441_10739 [Fusarium austroafricanum]